MEGPAATAATTPDLVAMKQHFVSTFGAPPADNPSARLHVIRAPGRVNLIGEHTDYNDGFVCPMAIEPQVLVICRSRTDGLVRLASTAFPGRVAELSINQKIQRIDAGPEKWTNYSRGIAAELLAAGIPLTGMDALIENTLPVGGGLSSSAAIEVGTGLALLTLSGESIDPMRLALLSQKAEHEYARVPVGLMDQMIIATARQGHATLFDCRSHSRQFIPIDPNELRVVIVNSMVKHELSGGEYAERRRQCEEGVRFFHQQNPAVKALRDVTPKQVEEARAGLDPTIFRRCRHVVTENARTCEFGILLTQRRYEQAGQLMVHSHNSLRDDYQVSTPELDYLSEQAMTVKGVYGARMTGGGFGGCVVALAQPRSVDPLLAHLDQTYHARFNIHPTPYVTTATAGASVLE